MYLTGIPLDLTTERFLGKSSENKNERVIFTEMTRKLLENKSWWKVHTNFRLEILCYTIYSGSRIFHMIGYPMYFPKHFKIIVDNLFLSDYFCVLLWFYVFRYQGFQNNITGKGNFRQWFCIQTIGGSRAPRDVYPPLVQLLKCACSFWEKLTKIIDFPAPVWKILNPKLQIVFYLFKYF